VHFRWVEWFMVDIEGARGGQKLLPHGYAQVVSETVTCRGQQKQYIPRSLSVLSLLYTRGLFV
jgi:hypothetical protein